MLARLALLFITLASGTAGACDSIILVVGDSLSAAYGMDPRQGWVALLGDRLREQGYDYKVVNASISGDTTSGGLARLPRALERHAPSVVVVELGGNDGLRGLSLSHMRENLAGMLSASKRAGAANLLTGIRIPTNYGPAYAERFHRMYRELASEFGAALVPHLLEDVALDEALMQADGIHPNEQAQGLILDRVWDKLVPLLRDKRAAATAK